jgi:tetratricopeptide (TPR) repeat protein
MFAFKLSFILFLTKVIYLIFYANSIKFAKTGKQTNMKLSEEDHKIVENLMTADGEKLKSLIKQLENQNSEAVTTVLTIILQLNPDEEIRSTAKEKLEKNLDFKQLANKNKCFELFRSLNEVLPWSNAQAVEIQQSNFAVFKKNLPHYEMLLAKYHTYSEIVLDAGRKLLLIFNLEEEAKFCFEIIVKHGISNDEALFALGRFEEKAGNYQKAVEFYEKTVVVNPKNSFAQMQIGLIKSSVFEKYEEALFHFSKASEEDPYSVEPYVRMAETAHKLGNIPQCRQYLEIALGINEYHDEALNLQGNILWKIENKYDEAVETFEKGIDHKIHEDSALLLKSLGDIYAQHFQEYNKAKVFYEKSLKTNPGQKSLIENYVPFVLKQFQDLSAVENAYINYLKSKPKDADMLCAYADFLSEYLKDYETAHYYLEQAIDIDPDHQLSLKLLRKISDYVDPVQEKSEKEDNDDEDEEDVIDFEEDWFEEEEDDSDDFSGGGSATDN